MAGYDAIVLGAGGVGSVGLVCTWPGAARASWASIALRPGTTAAARTARRGSFARPTTSIPTTCRWCCVRSSCGTSWKQRIGETLYHQVGLLQIGPPSRRSPAAAFVRAPQLHNLPIDNSLAAQCERRFPGFRVPPSCEAIFESRAGYLLVERCVAAHAELAVASWRRVATLVKPCDRWRGRGQGVVVETDRGRYSADRLIVTAGAWAGPLLADLSIPLVVRRKPLYWFRTARRHVPGRSWLPGVLVRSADGLLLWRSADRSARHQGGRAHGRRRGRRSAHGRSRRSTWPIKNAWPLSLPSTWTARRRSARDHAVCMYTMTPDAHFIVDRHPEYPQVVVGRRALRARFQVHQRAGRSAQPVGSRRPRELAAGVFVAAGRASLHDLRLRPCVPAEPGAIANRRRR